MSLGPYYHATILAPTHIINFYEIQNNSFLLLSLFFSLLFSFDALSKCSLPNQSSIKCMHLFLFKSFIILLSLNDCGVGEP